MQPTLDGFVKFLREHPNEETQFTQPMKCALASYAKHIDKWSDYDFWVIEQLGKLSRDEMQNNFWTRTEAAMYDRGISDCKTYGLLADVVEQFPSLPE